MDGLPPADALDAARSEVTKLALPELAGQLIVAAYDGTGAGDAIRLMRQASVAGVIVLNQNVPSSVNERAPAMRELSRSLQDEMTRSGRTWPVFLGVDQEGGPVSRVGAPLTQFPAAMALGSAGDPGIARAIASAVAEELRALGFTVIFGPDLDVT